MRLGDRLRQTGLGVLRLGAVMFLAGCSRAPAFNVLGSFFPGWIACIASGIVLTVILHFVLRRAGIERQLKALPLLYLCSALIFGSVLWLLLFE